MKNTVGFVHESELPIKNLVKQELITYRTDPKSGKMLKTTITRNYMRGKDYQDDIETEVLYAAN